MGFYIMTALFIFSTIMWMMEAGRSEELQHALAQKERSERFGQRFQTGVVIDVDFKRMKQ